MRRPLTEGGCSSNRKRLPSIYMAIDARYGQVSTGASTSMKVLGADSAYFYRHHASSKSR
jgi:hypothetical protein